MRALVRETELHARQLVLPLFARGGRKVRQPIGSMPGCFQLSVDELVKECAGAHADGVNAVLLFGIPEAKDEKASGAYAANGVVQRAVRALKKELPELLVITDVCLCEYMSHGHCGVVHQHARGVDIQNDATLKLLTRAATSHAEAGADIVAPSGMMDGVVGVLREALPDTTILSYAAKYSSAFYGPFRQAAESAPKFGDRQSYQMDPANGDEALREIDLDLKEPLAPP